MSHKVVEKLIFVCGNLPLVNRFYFNIRVESSIFDGLNGITISFLYAVSPSDDVYMEVAMCIRIT